MAVAWVGGPGLSRQKSRERDFRLMRKPSPLHGLFPMWGKAWGTLWKKLISPLLSMPMNPWGAAKTHQARTSSHVLKHPRTRGCCCFTATYVKNEFKDVRRRATAATNLGWKTVW